MPIFVSRFSSNRVVGANLRNIRSRQADHQDQARQAQEERRAQRAREDESEDQGRVSQDRTGLLVRNQRGEQLAERFQNARRSRETQQTETSKTETVERRPAAESQRSEPTERVTPGVGAVRSWSERNVERPGRLTREPANPAREQSLNRFASLRAVTRESGGSSDENRTAEVNSQGRQNGVGRLSALDSQIRQLATANRQAAAGVVGRGNGGDRLQQLDSQIRQLATGNRAPNREEGGLAGQLSTSERPTAIEISRANTTPEIRRNLQSDTREAGRGLFRDASRQESSNAQQTAETAGRAQSNRRERVARRSRAAVRNLQTEERDLEQALRQIQREIRSQQSRANRAESTASRSSTAAAALAGGNRVNTLAA